MFKQQLRWARGSQYNTLRMLPWMVGHAPMLAFFFTMDILLPFLLMGVLGGWAYRSLTGNGYNFYEGFLTSYGIQGGVMMVAGLMVASSVVSMSIRQIRHLSEKPSDFFRLPVFIVVSTFFLMPIRLIGFFRMAHAAGWGTRAGAYSGGPSEVSSDEEIAAFDGTVSATARATTMRDATKAAIEATGTVVTEPARRRRNPLAAIPYLIGIAILTAEALFLV